MYLATQYVDALKSEVSTGDVTSTWEPKLMAWIPLTTTKHRPGSCSELSFVGLIQVR